MTEIERILDQLKRAYEGNAWHGPSVREALAGVTASQAHARPLAPATEAWCLLRRAEKASRCTGEAPARQKTRVGRTRSALLLDAVTAQDPTLFALLQPLERPPSELLTVAPRQAKTLCGRPLDWIEVVA